MGGASVDSWAELLWAPGRSFCGLMGGAPLGSWAELRGSWADFVADVSLFFPSSLRRSSSTSSSVFLPESFCFDWTSGAVASRCHPGGRSYQQAERGRGHPTSCFLSARRRWDGTSCAGLIRPAGLLLLRRTDVDERARIPGGNRARHRWLAPVGFPRFHRKNQHSLEFLVGFVIRLDSVSRFQARPADQGSGPQRPEPKEGKES